MGQTSNRVLLIERPERIEERSLRFAPSQIPVDVDVPRHVEVVLVPRILWGGFYRFRLHNRSRHAKPIPPDEYVAWYKDVATNIRSVLADDGSYFLNIKEHADEGERSLYVKDPFPRALVEFSMT